MRSQQHLHGHDLVITLTLYSKFLNQTYGVRTPKFIIHTRADFSYTETMTHARGHPTLLYVHHNGKTEKWAFCTPLNSVIYFRFVSETTGI